jgi:hypothetical protein
MDTMQTLLFSVPTLALSLIYCLYNSYRDDRQRRQRRLRERVTYMLWVMAQNAVEQRSLAS